MVRDMWVKGKIKECIDIVEKSLVIMFIRL